MLKEIRNTWMGTVDRVKHAKNSLPFVTLLLTIAVIAFTCAGVVYNYASQESHYRKWKDYDDCGIL